MLRRFTTPANLVPRNAATGTPMLQSALLDEGGGNGVYARIVKFDNATGLAVAQYAYRMDTCAQGRGISSLVALGNGKFLVLERNNRGIGVGATISPADKAVSKFFNAILLIAYYLIRT